MSSFKDTYNASSEFKGGMVPPESIMIVGLDIPAEDWNQDLFDEARMAHAKASLDTSDGQAMVESIIAFGVTDPISVKRRREMTLAVDGRRRILAARRANEALAKGKSKVRISVPIVIDPTADQTVAMRLGNAYRLEDPPWVKANQAGQLQRLGKTDKEICLLLGGITVPTLVNWRHYLNCVPEIKRLVEMPDPGTAPLPFAVAYEIGKIGQGERDRQLMALETLQNLGAKTTGEAGRQNAKAISDQVRAGNITAAPEAPAPRTAREPREPRPPKSGPVVVTDRVINAKTLGLLCAALESSDAEPHENDAERLAHAMMMVLTGQDPDASGLAGSKAWKGIHVAFRGVLGLNKKKPTKTRAGHLARTRAEGK